MNLRPTASLNLIGSFSFFSVAVSALALDPWLCDILSAEVCTSLPVRPVSIIPLSSFVLVPIISGGLRCVSEGAGTDVDEKSSCGRSGSQGAGPLSTREEFSELSAKYSVISGHPSAAGVWASELKNLRTRLFSAT